MISNSMLLFLALSMIVVFVTLLLTNRTSVFATLMLIPSFFGILIVIFSEHQFKDLFDWIYQGLFFKLATDGSVTAGVIPAALLILFAIIYFNFMLDVGLFDPVIEFFIKQANGDPLKITMTTVLASTIVSMSGDTTSTVIILISAFRVLYQLLGMNLIYLSILIIGPNGILNMLPWGGPGAAASAAIQVDLTDLSNALYPGMILAILYTWLLAYYFGKKERKRLIFIHDYSKEIDIDFQNRMLNSIRERNPELKRPQRLWFNLLLTLTLVSLLVSGTAPGAILFMIGTALAITINYGDVSLVNKQLRKSVASASLPFLAALGAGVFSGILTGSGMSSAIGNAIIEIIPINWGLQMIIVYILITIPGLTLIPQEAFYFGIASVIANVMKNYGITRVQAAVASMMGQAFGMISPTIPALFYLAEETGQTFGRYQKNYVKYLWPIFFIYYLTYVLTGALPGLG